MRLRALRRPIERVLVKIPRRGVFALGGLAIRFFHGPPCATAEGILAPGEPEHRHGRGDDRPLHAGMLFSMADTTVLRTFTRADHLKFPGMMCHGA